MGNPVCWESVRLGDLVQIVHGWRFESEYFRDTPPGDVLLTPGNFREGGGFKGDALKYYDGPVADGYVLAEGDLLVTMTDLSKLGRTLGYPAFVPGAPPGQRYLHNQRLGKVIVGSPTRLLQRFLYYLLCTSDYRHEVLAGATGTTVRHTSPSRIAAFRFRLPSLREQKAIAHILGSLDDKIELNRQINETLQEILRVAFKSWFIDFDPVRAKAERGQPAGMDASIADLFPNELESTDLGEAPRGWQTGTLGGVAHQMRRVVTPEEATPETPYIGLEHMPRRCITLSTWGTADEVASGKYGFLQGELLFGKLRPYFHKVGVALVDGICSTDILVVAPKQPEWQGFVVGHLFSDALVAHADAHSTGTKMPRTNWPSMAGYKVVLPPTALAAAYNAVVSPMLEAIRNNVLQSRTLASIRDALLPKLLSGELRIDDPEAFLPHAQAGAPEEVQER
ncbi:MAG: restriction endonuclease subunit S [Armatimonadia bacterium]